MAIIFYEEGDHPAGFVGYRVATTLGKAEEFRQRYFSLAQYSPSEAEHLAQSLNAKWRADAEAEKKGAVLKRKRSFGGPGVIVLGLRAGFKVERNRKHSGATYISPYFAVNLPGYGRGSKMFFITKLGFDAAYSGAVELYCELHGMSKSEKTALVALKPDRALFTEILRVGLIKRDIQISEADIEAKLDPTLP